MCPPDAFDDVEPDESHFHEATGNEGASYERAYRRAALVLWPRARRMTLIGEAPPEAGLPYLEHLAEAWRQAGSPPDTTQWRTACALADTMVDNWPTGYLHDSAQAARLLTCLAGLRHAALADRYLEQMAAAGRVGGEEGAALAAAALLLPPQRAAALVETIVGANARFVPATCATMVSSYCAAGEAERASMAPAMRVLVDALLGRGGSGGAQGAQRRAATVDATVLVAALSALCAAGTPQQGNDVVAHWMAACPLDDVLVAAVLACAADPALAQCGAAGRLQTAVRRRIEERIAQPLAPPRDWRRPSRLPCTCQYCSQLAQFLDDPFNESWRLKVGEQYRRHVQDTIRRAQSDVDCSTLNEGRPYTLVCTKNQSSYEARWVQRAADLVLVVRLPSVEA